ncbi:glycosyltransferase family 2 protein [Paraburkholderia aspalathi]|nr:glycosyltransferase family 2 protein [Paraburkholderia aspalathi]MBK3780084.1 glycosyltransferase family 2 protein [Paraburkholderia aspalathi]
MVRMSAPTVSIIIPTHNGQDFLPRALRSLAAQTCQDFDVLVVSDDGFDYLPMARVELGDRVRHVFTPQPQSGPAIARSTGIALTSAQVLGFLEVDDEFSPQRVEKLLPLALEHGASACHLTRIDDATRTVVNRSRPAGMPRVGVLKAKHVPWLDAPMVPFVRRDCMMAYPDLRLFEDLFFLLRVVSRIGGEMPVVDEEEATYRYLSKPKSLSCGAERDDLTTRMYEEIIAQARSGGPLFDGVPRDAQDAFRSCFLLKSVRNAAYERAKRLEPALDFQQFSPRFDKIMAELIAQVPAHLQPWA